MHEKHIINAARPRLSDEEDDPIEQENQEKDLFGTPQIEGWLMWDSEDLFDVRRIIEERLPETQKRIVQAFLDGISFDEYGCSIKYYRYHLNKAVEFIQNELKI